MRTASSTLTIKSSLHHTQPQTQPAGSNLLRNPRLLLQNSTESPVLTRFAIVASAAASIRVLDNFLFPTVSCRKCPFWGLVLFSVRTHWRRQLWGTGARAPSTYNNLIFQYTLTCTKSDSDYMSTVASCEKPAIFACAPPLAPNPGDATVRTDGNL